MSESRTIPLSAIVGRSRFNVRPDGDALGRAAMKASIRAIGQLQALIVRVADHADFYEVDDGGCRWDAMCDLVRDDEANPPDAVEPWTWYTSVNVLVVNGDAGVARERSLAANVVRRQLHPVEECEAFTAMVADGLSIDTVAADFGVTARYVRQRLKLDELSPRVRAAWREDKISAGAAGVLTGVRDHAAQDAILDRHPRGIDDYAIRLIQADLRGTAVRGDHVEAIYVGVDDYVAAGGRLDEQLFDTAPLFLDPQLLKTLAAKKLMDFGLELAERHGFGSVINPNDLPADERYSWGCIHHFTQAEHDERRRYDAEEHAALNALPEDAGDEAVDEIESRYEDLRTALEIRAIARDTTPEQRAAAAIFVSVGDKGLPVADFGRTPPAARDDRPAKAPAPKPFAATPDPKAPAEPAQPAKLGKALVTVLDAALSEGFAVLVQQHPAVALTLATTVLTARRTGDVPVRLGARHWSVDAADRPLDWPAALAAELAQPQNLGAALERFARVIANTIAVDPGHSNGYSPDRRADPHQLAAMAELVAHTAGAEDYAEVMWGVLDYEAYFAAATRTAILAAIDEAGGVMTDARKLNKADLAAMAVNLCTDRRWMPRELRMPPAGRIAAALPAKSAPGEATLADAMADALRADGEDLDGDADEARALHFDPQTPGEAIAAFIAQHCYRSDETGYRIKAQTLFDAFQEQMPASISALLPSMRAFGDAVEAAGIVKKRLSGGVHYLGVGLRQNVQQQQAAE